MKKILRAMISVLLLGTAGALSLPANANPFAPSSGGPFLIGSVGYGTRMGSELGFGIAAMNRGGSGEMVVGAAAMRLKVADLDPERVGVGFDLGVVGILNLYVGADAYTDETFHAHVCGGILVNFCFRVGTLQGEPYAGLATELIL